MVGMLPTRPNDDGAMATGVWNDSMLRPLLDSSGVLLRTVPIAELCAEERGGTRMQQE